MRPYVLVFLLFLCSVVSSRAQDVLRQDSLFSLSIELKKPNGKIDRDAYVLMTVHNKTDKEFSLVKGSNSIYGRQLHSFLYSEVVRKNGESKESFCGTCIFQEKGKFYKIAPYGVYQGRIPIKRYVHVDEGTGLIPPKQMNTSKKIRAIIKKFTVGYASGNGDRELYQTTLYSNWLDVSNEDFSAIEDK